MLKALAERARQLRLLRDLSQAELAARSGVAAPTIKRFERTGQATILNVVRIALALGAEDGFRRLFEAPKFTSIDEALAPPMPRRGRARRRS